MYVGQREGGIGFLGLGGRGTATLDKSSVPY